MSNHVILCGLGELGFRTLEYLRAFGEQVVVVDMQPKPDFERYLDVHGVRLIRNSGNSVQALREAQIASAKAVIAVTPDDMTNLAIGLAAREENAHVRLVIRLFNHRLIEKVEREVPHCRVLDVAALAAPVFAFAGLHDDILHVIDVPGGRFLLRRWSRNLPANAQIVAVPRSKDRQHLKFGFVSAEGPSKDWNFLPRGTAPLVQSELAFALCLPELEETPLSKRHGWKLPPFRMMAAEALRLLGRSRKSLLPPILLFLLFLAAGSAFLFHHTLGLHWYQAIYFVVTIMTTTGFGDISLRHASPAIVLFGTGLMLVGAMLMAVLYAYLTDYLLSTRLAPFLGQIPFPLRQHFIMCGFGKVGYRIAEELRALGFPVIAIEKQEHSQLVELARRQGMPVLVTQDIYGALSSLRLEDARGVMAVTDDDIQNMELAFTAQESNPSIRVVMRLFDPHFASLVEHSFGIHLARSPSGIAAPAFAVAAAADDLLDAFDIGGVLWCVGRIEVRLGSGLEGKRAADLNQRQVLPISYRHGQGEWRPTVPSDYVVQPGDELVILTSRAIWLSLQEESSFLELH